MPSAITYAPVWRAYVAIAISTARALRSVGRRGDDGAVDLDELGVDLLQHLQAGVAGADVVERELEALRAQAPRHLTTPRCGRRSAR